MERYSVSEWMPSCAALFENVICSFEAVKRRQVSPSGVPGGCRILAHFAVLCSLPSLFLLRAQIVS